MSRGLRALVLALLAMVTLAGPARAQGLGIGLAALNDWSTEQPLLDVMKLARPWIGHKPGQWGGVSFEALRDGGVLDAQGWPRRIPPELGSIGTLVLTDLPEDAGGVAGRYRLSFAGSGIVEVGGRATGVRYAPGRVEFDFAPGPGPVDIRIQRSDPGGTGDYVRDISIVRLDREAAWAAGAVFNPDWLARIEGFGVLRFMDWMATNGSALAHWADRPEVEDFAYTLNGMPLELMLRLANETGHDAWFTLPHLADDDFVRRFAEAVKAGLDPGRRAYVEYSNEVWNWGFAQAQWAEDQARARWGQEHAWVQYYAMRAAEVAAIWTEVFGAQAPARLVRVISTQTGWLGLEADILGAPLWLAEAPGRAPPVQGFDAYAVAGYFGGDLGNPQGVALVRGWLAEAAAQAGREAEAAGLTGEARAARVAAQRTDLAVEAAARYLAGGADPVEGVMDLRRFIADTLAYQARIAAEAGLELIAYEGGSHAAAGWEAIDDADLTAFFTALNYSAPMGALYAQLFDGWRALGGGVFVAYADVQAPGKWGSWGSLRHLTDDNPRWQALLAAQAGGR